MIVYYPKAHSHFPLSFHTYTHFSHFYIPSKGMAISAAEIDTKLNNYDTVCLDNSRLSILDD